jgi:hypothetical protein
MLRIFFILVFVAAGAHAELYFRNSGAEGVTCLNQIGFPGGAAGTASGVGCSDLPATFAVFGTAIVNVDKYTSDLCDSDRVVKVSDTDCNEVARAAHICLEAAGSVFLLSCNDDIEVGDFGTEMIK